MTALARQHKTNPKAANEAIRDYIATHKSGIGRLVTGLFEIQTLEQAEKLSTMLANNYPQPERVSTGIWELISNAIEHGNLGIDQAEKGRLINSGGFAEEVSRRLAMPDYAGRIASVEFRRTKTMIRLRVTDEGKGFDFNTYLSATTTPDGPNGRGILIASKFSFDKIVYRGRGNIVDAVIKL